MEKDFPHRNQLTVGSEIKSPHIHRSIKKPALIDFLKDFSAILIGGGENIARMRKGGIRCHERHGFDSRKGFHIFVLVVSCS